MGIWVLSGGPGTGKSSVIAELEKRGIKVLIEAAREIGESDERFKGRNIGISERGLFEKAIFELQKRQYLERFNSEELVISDRGFGDTLAYYLVDSLPVPEEDFIFSLNNRYKGIFVLDFLDFYENDSFRDESVEEQRKIHEEIIKMYRKLGYNVVFVPFMSVEERADFVLDYIDKN